MVRRSTNRKQVPVGPVRPIRRLRVLVSQVGGSSNFPARRKP